ncbi:uncharacterized protein KNAG_0D05230 [Huiozyma naganishii CBS 8797]|uniref:Major facilitator superfamily (MFS) profile domain-containing protein n=1 Tax=Huiozyma naganishii (strain ATCC MYA-139 / BCRC 22969 / CBS 8797 / KCTC 17520 / NBRC 10181 / NCYC 3082 / Yp74L-3) TaxID=1071383 RepID=J7S7D4_HUIN7|nr:hypothetical protein KNAG_0D05230 [Kazachstania naganishii CBS 8797]CCK70261.1 hypothetical protein KNAG_0D05230 [Kazachstania naganishii CBS 8797]
MAMNVWVEVKSAPRDIKLLWASVFLRLLSFGVTNQLLTLFLRELHMREDKIGLFMSLTLAGDVACSYVLTWYADVWGRRKVLMYGAVMMFLSGLVFATSESFNMLLVFAIFGVISPSSDEVGPFKSIEESMIAHLSPNNKRPEIYAIHGFVATLGAALGAIISGAFIHTLKYTFGVESDLKCYKWAFVLYAAFALGKLIMMSLLSERTELDSHFHNEHLPAESIVTDEMAPLLEQRQEAIEREEQHQTQQAPNSSLSKETVSILMRLLVIFMTDSLGSGFMTNGWMVYYYKKWFHMKALGLGTLFFCTQLVMTATIFPSSILPRIFGPVRATLLVQVPSAIFSILIPLASEHLSWSISFWSMHFGTSAMDVTSRQILLTNLIRPQDLTKVMGVVNMGKTFSRCIGPTFTGLLAKRGYLWVCYIVSGVLVMLADAILACSFLHVDKQILQQINS